MRTIDPTALAALAGSAVSIALLVEMDLTEPLFLNSSRMDLVVDGNTYLGLGPLGKVDPIQDTSSELPRLQFQLSGVPSDMVALMLAEPVQGKAVRIKLAIFNAMTGAVLDAPLRYAGVLDVMGMADGKDSASISVSAESATLDLLRPSGIYYNDADQQALHTGDLSFQFVNDQVDKKIIWPAWAFWGK